MSNEIVTVSIDVLKIHPRNAEFFDDISGDAYENFKASIKEDGIISEIIVAPDMTIISGHQRYKAAKELGIPMVPIRVREDLVDEDKKLKVLLAANFQRPQNDEAKQRKIAVEYVRLCGYKNGEMGNGREKECQNGTPKMTLDEIASQLGTSKRNLQRALSIERNLTESMKELLDTGVISKTLASDLIASLSEEEQEELISSMSLKQEFLDIMQVIAPNINSDSCDEDYTIEQDFMMEICTMSGENVTYGGCFECENYKDTSDCNHKIYKNVDVYLWSSSEESIGYTFKNKSNDYKCIRCINNREQLLSELSILKKRFDYYKDSYAEYTQRIEEYKKYIVEFATLITKEFTIFSKVNIDMIPVVFCNDYRKDHDWNQKTYVSGDFNTNGRQSIIHIYNSWDSDMDDVKMRIRHEIIHYLLWYITPLLGWYTDESAIFWYFCNIYDAGAYKEMDEINSKLYEQLIIHEKGTVNYILQRCLDECNLQIPAHLTTHSAKN